VEKTKRDNDLLSYLMKNDYVTHTDIQQVVAIKGYYSIDTPIDQYDPYFICTLIKNWQQLKTWIKDIK